MNRGLSVLLVVAFLALAGCNGDEDAGSDVGSAASSPSSAVAPVDPEAGAVAYRRAEAAMQRDDYDTAIPLMEGLGDFRDARSRAERFRSEAARGTLANARRKIGPSPRAAVSLTKTALRYQPTPEGRAFLARAEAALERFKRSERDDDDTR